MASTTISHAHWQLILERIHSRRCVPFLGAGANVSSDGYTGLPLGAEVTRHLIEDLTGISVAKLKHLASVRPHPSLREPLREFSDLTRVGLNDLARVAMHVQRAYDTPHLIDVLRKVLPDADREPSELLTTLARLPSRLIVTSNYDRLMERALTSAEREYRLVVQPPGGFDDVDLPKLQDELAVWGDRLILYKIHGTFIDEDEPHPMASRRLTVTEEDYIEFLTVAAIENRGVPSAILREMTSSTLLLLGYSLEDWDFRTIFKGLIETLPRHDQRTSFAIQRRPAPFWVNFWEKKQVVIYDVDLYRFAHELESRYRARYGPVGQVDSA